MKKSIIAVLCMLMAFAIIFAFPGCNEKTGAGGGTGNPTQPAQEKVALTAKTVNGLTFKVPDDFKEFAETGEVMLSTNEKSTASIAVSKELDMMGMRPEGVTKDYYLQTVLPKYSDVQFLEFKTDVEISYSTAVYAHFTATSGSGLAVEVHAFLIYLPVQDGDGFMQSLVFSFTKDSQNSLNANMDAIKSSITFE